MARLLMTALLGTCCAAELAAATTAAPVISVTPAEHGAVVVRLASATPGATIHYTLDGAEPTLSAEVYRAPFLVASDLMVAAIAEAPGADPSGATRQSFALHIRPGTRVWSEEFNNRTGSAEAPDAKIWTFDVGNSGFGNHELETYCAWGADNAPCAAAEPNLFVGTDGFLHLVARRPGAGVYTSARLKSQGLFSFRYGRIEFRARVPEAQGFWPAAWLLGNNIASVQWPACGEQDILERVNAAKTPDWNEGSVHGQGFIGNVGLSTAFPFPQGQTAAEWHTYGMIWAPGTISYYVDDPARLYATYTPASLKGMAGARWPFDDGQDSFILINLAIGGDWPGQPDAESPFPAEMLVDYVRIYTE